MTSWKKANGWKWSAGRWNQTKKTNQTKGETNKKKKANGRWGEERQTVPKYVQRPLGLCASKGYEKHKHCQHASSVEANSQNGCTAMAPNTDQATC